MRFYKYMLMDKAGEGTGGSGGNAGAQNGGGDPLFDASKGGSGTGGNPGGAGGAGDVSKPNPEGGANPGGQAGGGNISIPANWKDILPGDIKDSPIMQLIADVPALAKAYFNAQKMVGADKIAVPGTNATKEMWSQVWEKLGMPKTEADYKIDLDKSVTLDKDLETSVVKLAHEQGILPRQAKALLEHMWKAEEVAQKRENEKYANEVNDKLKALRSEWGDQYDNNVAKAKAAMKEYADEETMKFIRENGFGRNAGIIKLFSKIGETLGEGKIREAGGGGEGGMTPAQAQAQIDEIFANPKHANFDKTHPDHANTRKKVTDLFKIIASAGKTG